MKWIAITIRPIETTASNDSLDEICSELMTRGALGTTITSPPEITCYLPAESSLADTFVSHAKELGCDVLTVTEISDEHWTGACPEVWEPIRAGSLEVIPVESPSDPRATPPHAIKIIPGLGFGTGHHATTRMVLSELTKLQAPARPHAILDLGTGSGILAIAAAKLFGSPVEAIDIDPMAIENARDNTAMNGVDNLIELSTKPLRELSGPYDLILANVYGEVLVQLASEVSRVAQPHATIIMSGITELVWNQVYTAYCSTLKWRVEDETSENGWVCAVLRR